MYGPTNPPPDGGSLITISLMQLLITGVFSLVSVEAAAAMAMNKYKSNRSGGSEMETWVG